MYIYAYIHTHTHPGYGDGSITMDEPPHDLIMSSYIYIHTHTHILGYGDRTITRDDPLTILSWAQAADCFAPVTSGNPLTSEWTLTCLSGPLPCSLVPPLWSVIPSIAALELRIPPRSFPAGVRLRFTLFVVHGRPDDPYGNNEDFINVNIAVRPPIVSFSGNVCTHVCMYVCFVRYVVCMYLYGMLYQRECCCQAAGCCVCT